MFIQSTLLFRLLSLCFTCFVHFGISVSALVILDICRVSLLIYILQVYLYAKKIVNWFWVHLFIVFLHESLFNDFRWLLLAGWSSSHWTSGRHPLCLWFELWLVSGIYRYIGIDNEGALHLLFVFLVSSCVQSIYCMTLCLALARLEWENWLEDSYV